MPNSWEKRFFAFGNDVTVNRNGTKCKGMRFSKPMKSDETCLRFNASVTLAVVALLSTNAWAVDPVLPNPQLTPGAVGTTDTGAICQDGYSRSVRHTSGRL